MKTRKLEEILVERGLVRPPDIARVLDSERARGQSLGTLLVQQGLITEEDLLEALSEQFGLPYWRKLEEAGIERLPVSKVPIAFYRQQKVFPIVCTDSGVKVAVSDPLNIQPLDDLAVFLGTPVEPVLSSERELMAAINRFFDRETGSTEQVMQDLEGEDLGAIANEIEETDDLLDLASEAPVIRLVNSILTQAVRARASDIHIEPFERELKVRYRIDGILYNTLTPPRRLQAAISSRIKVMANLNIAERRLPQDGRIRIRVGEKDVDIRVSVVPTAYGERIVLRILDKTSVLLGVEEIGMAEAAYGRYSRLIKRSNGIILVTGPTGSGKTTTLYATLNKINAPELNIITIEDPIEYQLGGIGQIQVNPRIDLTFANGLAVDSAPGSGYHHGGRNSRSGDGRDRDPGLIDGTSRVQHTPYQRCVGRRDPSARHGGGGLSGVVVRDCHHRAAPGTGDLSGVPGGLSSRPLAGKGDRPGSGK